MLNGTNTSKESEETKTGNDATSYAIVPYIGQPSARSTTLESESDSSFFAKFQYGFTFYTVSVLPRILPILRNNRPWWSTIIPGLKLGAIPIADWEHGSLLLEESFLESRKLGLVVSCCGDFELKGNGLLALTPVSPHFWVEKDVTHLQVKMRDFGGDVPLEQIRIAVEQMHQCIHNGKTAYVHCKAGRGRSVVMVICYLMQFLDYTPEEAIAFVREKRPEISLSKAQYHFIEQYRAEYRSDLTPLYSKTSEQEMMLRPVNISPSFVSTPSWLASTLWYIVTLFNRNTVDQHCRTLETYLLQDFSALLRNLNAGQIRTLHASLTGQRPYTQDLVWYYPIYAAGQAARNNNVPQVEELTLELDKKLKL
ncbi:dual specificity protein phosphatase family protein [Candidatus Berkiella cookevillensis]|uniref:Dual specificity protein phosphatase family protein n=1 Tax=Candidatus Berkiella cookevillensis TaxID=437022 RepID=A0A0Q9YDM4_9GAMM|nr:dual specificity protein phosphatase family protein [Candidatus Berkiella cookevillensis]MCS5707808.1 dual specificity protein phosphatase family protein [Candidatus Berkiella cookevillensis]